MGYRYDAARHTKVVRSFLCVATYIGCVPSLLLYTSALTVALKYRNARKLRCSYPYSDHLHVLQEERGRKFA